MVIKTVGDANPRFIFKNLRFVFISSLYPVYANEFILRPGNACACPSAKQSLLFQSRAFGHGSPSVYKSSGCPSNCVLCRYPTKPCHLVNSGLFSGGKLLLARWLIDFLAGRVDKPHNMSKILATGVEQNASYTWDRTKEAQFPSCSLTFTMPATATTSALSRCIAWFLGKSSRSPSEGLVEKTEELRIVSCLLSLTMSVLTHAARAH